MPPRNPYDDLQLSRFDSSPSKAPLSKSSGLQPYTFIPGQINLGDLVTALGPKTTYTTQSVMSRDQDYHGEDPEVLDAATILWRIHEKEVVSIAAREAQQWALERTKVLKEDSIILSSPEISAPRTRAAVDKPRMTRSKMAKTAANRVVSQPKPKPKSSTKKKTKAGEIDNLRDHEYFDSPVLAAIHNSPAKKSKQNKTPMDNLENGEESDTTEIANSSLVSDADDENDGDYTTDLRTLYVPERSSDSPSPQPVRRAAKPVRYHSPPEPSVSPITRQPSRNTSIERDDCATPVPTKPRAPFRIKIVDEDENPPSPQVSGGSPSDFSAQARLSASPFNVPAPRTRPSGTLTAHRLSSSPSKMLSTSKMPTSEATLQQRSSRPPIEALTPRTPPIGTFLRHRISSSPSKTPAIASSSTIYHSREPSSVTSLDQWMSEARHQVRHLPDGSASLALFLDKARHQYDALKEEQIDSDDDASTIRLGGEEEEDDKASPRQDSEFRDRSDSLEEGELVEDISYTPLSRPQQRSRVTEGADALVLNY